MGKSLITKIIIGVVIAILLIIVISSIVKFAHRDRPDDVAEPIQEYIDQVKGKLVKSDNITNLYQAKLCIQKYYEYLCDTDENEIISISYIKSFKCINFII